MLAGTLSLAGFPLITAGFWSKDEILADSLLFITNNSQFEGHAPWLHIVVFFSLFIAAMFTAFYSLRMWFLTFWGEARSEIAEHATLKHEHHHDHAEHHHEESHAVVEHDDHHETEGQVFDFKAWWSVYRNSALMQGPLVVLAFFAITAGWVGIHPDFPILEWLTASNNFFHDFVGGTLAHHPETIKIHWLPVLASFTAFGVGASFAWILYKQNPLKADQKDPMQEQLGDGIWSALQNRLWIDTLWLAIFYVPFEWFARKIAYVAIDKETIDEFLHGVGDFFVGIGEVCKRFNRVVIDGVGDGIPMMIWQGGRYFRNLQSGRIQQYLLFSALMMLAIGTFFVLQLF